MPERVLIHGMTEKLGGREKFIMELYRRLDKSRIQFDFVCDNRDGTYYGPQYDFKFGPVANDDMQQTIGIYLSGIITEKMCIQLLKPHKLKNQYTFKTEQAIATLEFRDVIRNWQ